MKLGTTFTCDDIIIKNSLSDKILGLTIDNNLDFSDRIFSICKIANQKLTAVFRVSRTNDWGIQISLMIEVYKCLNGLSPDIVNDVLAVSKHRYNTHQYNLFVTDPPKNDI